MSKMIQSLFAVLSLNLYQRKAVQVLSILRRAARLHSWNFITYPSHLVIQANNDSSFTFNLLILILGLLLILIFILGKPRLPLLQVCLKHCKESLCYCSSRKSIL
ncbi:hypothetical protein ACB094_10G011100 [Castanea mollissima]